MKIAISNIAWDHHEDFSVANILKNLNIQGVEIAPSKMWNEPTECSDVSIESIRQFWNQHDISLVAMQSILYNKPHLHLFANEESRSHTKSYIFKIIRLASMLGIKAIVFGSPKNRTISKPEDHSLGIAFFSELGAEAEKYGVCVCIEPNPMQYGSNYILNTQEAIRLVSEVNSTGFRLHLDLSSMILNEEKIEEVIAESIPYAEHFHISEPYLELISENYSSVHRAAADSLRKHGYNKWVSIEMKNGLRESNLDAIKQALEFVIPIYR